MLPLGHAAVGYLLSAVAAPIRGEPPPRGVELAVLLVGTQFPDLVDKPIAALGITSYGRFGTHSLVLALPLVALLYWRASSPEARSLVISFGIGYLSHPIADAYQAFGSGRWQLLTYLTWPLPPVVLPQQLTELLWAVREGVYVTADLEGILIGMAIVVWVAHWVREQQRAGHTSGS